jgi:hypothetical protein
MQHDPAYDEIRRMVEHQFLLEKARRARILLRLNIAVTVGFLLFIWVRLFPILDDFWSDPKSTSLLVLSIAAVVGLIIHGIAYRLNTTRGERALREQLLGRAVHETLGGDDLPVEKAKRHARLSDDGELLDIVDDEDEQHLKRTAR